MKFAFLLILCGLFTTVKSYAEGSKDLYPAGALGGRACLVSTGATKTGWTLTNRGVHYAYVRAGETIAAASSAQGIASGQIIFTAPDGTVYSSSTGSTTTGHIANRTQELQGPWVGYTPYTRVAGAGQTGLWKVELLSTQPSTSIVEGSGANWQANAAWTQHTASSAICAWDVAVRNAGNTIVRGRVYTNVLNMFVQYGDYRGKLFVMTKDGYVFAINNNGSNGLGFVGFVNNRGLTRTGADSDAPLYKSVAGTNLGSNVFTWDPRADDGAISITHKMFYNVPDESMPATAPMPGNKSTWLNMPKVAPTVSDINVDGVEGTAGQVSSKGAYIKFNASTIGTFRISLTGSGSFVPRKLTGTAVAGANSIFWDGRDGAGNRPSLGTANIAANIQLQGSEIHFPFIDVEDNFNGLIIEQLADDNVTVESDIVYWADSSFALNGFESNPLINGNEGNGISSNTNGHRWGSNFGNDRTMDTWTYILGEAVTKNTSLNIVVADLSVENVAPATSATQVTEGDQVTYTVTVMNHGPSGVTGAPFAIKVPTGFTIANVSAVTYNTTNVTVNSPALDASGNYSALLDMPNGATITFTFTGTATNALIGQPINIETSIMRPKDVTDPDATNPDANVPPTDPHVECRNGGATENCNNIKYNSVVGVVAGANLAVTKTTTATSVIPGNTVNYTFTVRNVGGVNATNVRVIDNAPTGTTISAWTAAFTTGTGTLPATTGTGNIDQTISTLTAGAVVTYTVTVSVPSGFTGTLQNTASASSPDDHSPANNTSTTSAIPAVPQADIQVQKTTTNAYYAEGQPVTYTVTVMNNGPSTARNVVVVDNAPANTVISDWSVTATPGSVLLPATSGTGNLNQTIAELPNGGVLTYTIRLHTTSGYNGTIANTASASADETDPTPANNSVTTTPIGPDPRADMAITKSTTATAFTPGEDVTYNITITNNGPGVADSVYITDVAPTGTVIKSWTATSPSAGLPAFNLSGTGDINETISRLPGGAYVDYVVVVSTPANFTGTLSNTATVGSLSTDNDITNNTATTTPISSSPEADMSVVVNTGVTTYTPGETITYTITVTNNGPSDASSVNILDNAPSGTTIQSWTATTATPGVSLPATTGSGNINQTIPVIPANGVVTYTVVVSVPSGQTGTLTNTATVSSPVTDNVPANNSGSSTLTAAPKANLAVAKSTTATSFAPGEDVTYTFTVTNNGPSNAVNVVVSDNAPAGTTISSWTAATTTGTFTLPATSGTGNINQTIASLPNGAVATYTVVVATPSSFTGSLSNSASVTSDVTDETPGNNTSTTTAITPTPRADIAVAKTTTATTFAPGEDVVYTFTVTNNGPSNAANVVVTDNAPTGTIIRSWTAATTAGTFTLPATSGTGNINQTIASLPNGAVATYTVVVATPSSFTGNLSNTASATTSSANDNIPGNNTSTTTGITPSPKADIRVVKTTSATTFAPGEDVTYTITITNNGPSNAANVVVTDNAPTGTTIRSWTAATTTGTFTLPATSGTGNINQTIASLPNGAVATYTVVVATPADFTGNLSNSASATSDATDETPGNNTSTTAGITPSPKADIRVVKTTTATTFAPGEDVTYTIAITNNGPSNAANVVVTDNAPTGTTIRSWTAAATTGTFTLPATSGTGNINQTIASLPNGAVATYTVVVATPADFTGNLSNSASATSDATDETPGNNTSTTTGITPSPKADIRVVKTTTATTFAPGEDVTYTITITNNGPSNAANVVVTDNAPTGTTIRSWTAAATTGTFTLPATSGTGNINQTIASLPNDAVATYTVVVATPADFTGNLSNSASASSDATDETPGNNTSTTTGITASPKADIRVVKTTTATTFAPGEDVTYTITITNNGPSNAANVVVTDNAPTGTTIRSWTAAATTGTFTLPATSGTGNINQTIASLPNGAVATYTVVVATPSSFTGNLSNSASANSGDATDETPGNNTSTTTGITPSRKADIAITKSTAATTFAPGEDVTYTITITNNGPSDAANVVVTDNAPTGTTIKSWTAATTAGTFTLPATSGTGNINQIIANLPNGAIATYTVVVATPSSFTGSLSNSASASSDATDDTPGNNSSTTTGILPSPIADIAVTKSTTATTYVPGKELVYIITVTNNGPSDAPAVNITDAAPAGTTITSWTAAVTTGTVTLPANSGTGNINQTIATLPNGAIVTYTVTLRVAASRTGNLSNTATATTTATDNTPGNNSSSTPGITETREVDLSVVKTTTDATITTYIPGSAINYTITVTNNGSSDARNVTIRDIAPAGTMIRSWSAASVAGNVPLVQLNGAGGLDEVLNILPAGGAVRYDLILDVPANFKGNITNTAVTGSDVTDVTPANNTSTTTPLTPVYRADIAVNKTLVNPAQTTFKPGDEVFYYITIENHGPSDAVDVNIQDTAPAGTNIFYWGVNILNGTVSLPNRNGNTDINETVALLPAGAVIRYQVGVKVHNDHTGNLTNTATVTTTTTDAVPGNNTSTSPVLTDASSADVVITKAQKTATQTSATAGRILEYVITVTNAGPDAAAKVNVKDVAPAGTTIHDWTTEIVSGTPALRDANGTGDLDAEITLLPTGAVVLYHVNVLIPQDYTGTSISNTATATSITADPVTTNNSVTTPAIPVVTNADLSVSKTTTAQYYIPGRTVDYTIDVVNNGPSAARSVNISDIAPAGTTISAWTATVTNGSVTLPANSGTGNLNQTITILPSAAEIRYVVTVAIPAAFSGDITNTATVSSTTADDIPGNNTSTTATLTPQQTADLEVSKQLKDPSQQHFIAGQDVVYVITVKNNGPAPATKVNIKDIAPAGTTISAWTATVINGTVALPGTSGTGNLNETIELMPDQSVVAYEVTVTTPDDFQGALINVADVSSETSDPAPECAGCTAPAVAAEPLPVADTDDYGDVRANNPVTIPVLVNDKPGKSSAPLDPSSIEIVQQPAHGTLIVNPDGTIVYTPEEGYFGSDSFTYRVKDQQGSWSNVATVNMNVTPDEVEVPNVITPNGDGVNDKLVIKGLNKFVQNEIVIYNRWNNVLYRKQNYQGEWDGQGLRAGTYYYTLKGLDANGQWHTYNGYIMLLLQ
ncbi:T9SS type B sorting domain-containing protein [Chitinophaga rhizophila]|uniref:DUF11 domain-containing protein n=1 Tax=Chitinophaga rhizophila TaxID=2866212 RepID=A0ABS7GBL4_9BACT|nr:gliding motility-associated C-terminal domain-containing protein [Chitinophaga rhizophila]MBW8684515.1 DUF11 domain-containing protein [Chitinophaga rhizophila]